jgi:hypothetical protein
MKAAAFKLPDYLTFMPDEGKLLFRGQRMVVISTDSFGDLMKDIIAIGGVNFARIFIKDFMFGFGKVAGKQDARTIKERLDPDSDNDWLALGPIIHTWEGVVKAIPEVISIDRESGEFYMKGIWQNSFIADQYINSFGKSKDSICWLLTGYATGYASEFFGRQLLAKEPTCRGKGDEVCRFEIKPVEKWDEELF